jgi:hypothetical protein
MRWANSLALALLVLALGACRGRDPSSAPPGESSEAFLASHWAQPRIAQAAGAPASLAPASCGECHRAQLEDWRGSLHSRAMGPGVAGQLASMSAEERADCQRCHAPLREQTDARSALYAKGLICASCHVRNGRVYGPARRDGSALAGAEGMPHGGWGASPAFENSRFCATCHQFPKDGYALNGKLLENTYEEWRASRHAREGRACQGCHMPDRRHLWRGIHDREMARSALTVQPLGLSVEQGDIRAAWQIANTGAGHFFPTYVTPRVVIRIRQESAGGVALEGTLQENTIERRLTPDLSSELFDTRIAPDEKRVVAYAKKRDARARLVALEVRVEPDALYTELYLSLLRESTTVPGREQIAQALRASLASRYTLYAERIALPGPAQAATASPSGSTAGALGRPGLTMAK